jgi:predicted lipoprotein with Yx(FWY)xxD motif
MTQISSVKKIVSVVFLVLVVALTVGVGNSFAYQNTTAQNQTPKATMNPVPYSVNITSKPGIGSYLTNATGWTLYTFARDVPASGSSVCTGSCMKNWPPFYVTNLTISPTLNATSFSIISRPDGGKQVTYNGWPLYFFRNDTKPGDTNGQGLANAWFVCTYPTPFTLTSNTTAATTASSRKSYD